MDLLAAKLNGIRAKGLVDDAGYPRLAVTFGSGGIAPAYLGTFAAFLAAWGPVDQGIGSGQGVKCYHSEHLYGEFWHRAFTVAADIPRSDFVLSFGYNGDASGGVTGVFRHAEARARGIRWVQLEPHLSVTGAGANEWVPVRPKTDAAVLFALLHVILLEHDWRAVCDVPFLTRMTSSPYLVGPGGYYLRDPETQKPLVWDLGRERPVPFDDPDCIDPAMTEGRIAAGVEVGADGARRTVSERVKPAFAHLLEHSGHTRRSGRPEIADVPVDTIRRLAKEYLEHARVGATIDIDGVGYPHRPVAVVLGKTVTNGWGGYECCWARTMLAAVVGALEVPGGILGTAVRLNRPAQNRLASVKPGPDGFMEQPLNPTEKGKWKSAPHIRNAYQTLVPLANNSPWSAALGPAHLPWLFSMIRPNPGRRRHCPRSGSSTAPIPPSRTGTPIASSGSWSGSRSSRRSPTRRTRRTGTRTCCSRRRRTSSRSSSTGSAAPSTSSSTGGTRAGPSASPSPRRRATRET